MKKKVSLLLLSLILAFALVACGPSHECKFGEEWKTDAAKHWHECECGEKAEEATHTFGEWETNESGEKERSCSTCGYADTCLEHDPKAAEKENEVLATCTTKGSYESVVYCAICNKELTREMVETDKLPHEEETISGHAATCEENGLTDGKRCTECSNVTLEQQTILASGHKDGKATYAWSSNGHTCTASLLCKNDESHILATETAVVTQVVIKATASKVTYEYKAAFQNQSFTTQTKPVEDEIELVEGIATVNAPTIQDRVPSHDYVKFDFSENANATHTFEVYYSEIDVWDGTSVSSSLKGTGAANNPYLIESGADLAYFAKVVNEHTISGTVTVATGRYTVYTDVYFKLTKSIDLDDNCLKIGYNLAWNNYSRFGGIFDGNNCSIRGLKITEEDTDRNDALFGMIYNATIKHLSVYGSIYGGGVLNGGIVGFAAGADSQNLIENCTSYVDINGDKETGGIVGNIEGGIVVNCVNYGKVICAGDNGGVIVGKHAGGNVINCISYTELNEG